jgi:predicted Rossmann fold flavoprotein
LQNQIVIIGGGASGIFCAVNLARLRPNLQITVLEKSNKLLGKVKISGGGRCNVTNACESIAIMAKCYPRGEKLVKTTFRNFFTTDTIQWFAKRNVLLVAEADGRMFPVSNSSQTIIDCLLQEATKYKVQIQMHVGVQQITKTTNGFDLSLSNNNTLQSSKVVIACGGFPKLEQFAFITNLGHTVSLPVPSLFTFNIPKHGITQLMGVVAPQVIVRIMGSKLQSTGPILITHWGLSGPCILSLSAYAARFLYEQNYNYTIQINWIPSFNETSLLEHIRTIRNSLGANKMYQKNITQLPNRLWQYILNYSEIWEDCTWANLPSKLQNVLVKNLCAFTVNANGKTTYKEEFVTAGGVALNEIDYETCESKLIPNVYFAGEILDVDGKTGGYNFQHAWSSGMAVAKAIAGA